MTIPTDAELSQAYQQGYADGCKASQPEKTMLTPFQEDQKRIRTLMEQHDRDQQTIRSLADALRGLLSLAEGFDPMREDGEEEVSEVKQARAALARLDSHEQS